MGATHSTNNVESGYTATPKRNRRDHGELLVNVPFNRDLSTNSAQEKVAKEK